MYIFGLVFLWSVFYFVFTVSYSGSLESVMAIDSLVENASAGFCIAQRNRDGLVERAD